MSKRQIPDIPTIVKALRCSATPYSKQNDCEHCPYRLLELYDEKFPVPYDIEIDGNKYYETCDCDSICIDAADILEKNYLEEAMIYIKGYCNKHAECKPYCRLYNEITQQCFLADGSIPADWHIEIGDEENE